MSGDVRNALEGGWQEVEGIDDALARGEIDEVGWYAAMQALIVPRYLAAGNPRAQSGHSGDEERWERARSLLLDGVTRDGTLLDIGCANGHLMESVRAWAAARGLAIEPYGVDLSAEMVALAARRLPQWRDRLWVANALDWEPPRRFDFVHLQNVDYVSERRRPQLVAHIRERLCAAGGRLIVGPFNERRAARALEERVAGWGHAIAGRGERAHRHPEVAYRVFWIDASETIEAEVSS